MNEADSKLFIQDLVLAFPAFLEVAERVSPNVESTKTAWAKAWFDLSLSECRAVLNRLLIDGGIKYENYREPGPFIRRLVLASRRNIPKSEAELVAERNDIAKRRQRQADYANRGFSMSSALESLKLGARLDEVLRDV